MKNILSDLNEIYEGQARKIFSFQKSRDSLEMDRNNYEKYYQQCIDNLAEIDVEKITEEVSSLENDIKSRVTEIETLEDTLKKLMINEKRPESNENMNVGYLASASALAFPDDYQTLSKVISHFKEKANQISSKMQSLEDLPMDSIKRIKSEYENQDEALIGRLHRLLNEKYYSIKSLMDSVKEKLKVFEDKMQIKQANTAKVDKFVVDLNNAKEKSEQANVQNQMTLEEIESYKSNVTLVEEDFKRTESSLRPLKVKTTWTSPVNLAVSHNTTNSNSNCNKTYCPHILKLSTLNEKDKEDMHLLTKENESHAREMETNLMLCEDFVAHKEKNLQIDFVISDKRCNILSWTGLLMNSLSQKLKLSPIKSENENIECSFSLLSNSYANYEQARENEAKCQKMSEKYCHTRDEFRKIKGLLLSHEQMEARNRDKLRNFAKEYSLIIKF